MHAAALSGDASVPSYAFDSASGSRLERLVFHNRRAVLLVCLVLTLLLGAVAAARLGLNASFDKMIPSGHPYIQNYLQNRGELRGLGNSLRIVVENPKGTVDDPRYLEALKKVHDELFLTPGVDRAWVKSLWAPGVRWTEVTEEGFRGGPVMPDNYDGKPASTEQLRANIARANLVGSLVGTDFRSSMIVLPLLDRDPSGGQRLDYRALSNSIESIRARYEAMGEQAPVRLHVTGFAKLVGDLIAGLVQVSLYFVLAAVIAALIIYAYTRCLRSTGLVIACSLVAVAWQLGLVAALGFELDPYSILVPFLVFAIGVSHGAQKMNGIMQDIGRGADKLVAARLTFRRLFLAGLTALLADAVGFGVLMVIDIPVIRELALAASLGVAVLIVTNLILLPVLLSYLGVSPAAAARTVQTDGGGAVGRVFAGLERFVETRWSLVALGVAALLTVGGYAVSTHLKIGDLDAGAPELRADSRYNRDNAYTTAHYSLSSDTFAVIVKTAKEGCLQYQTLIDADRLAWELQQVPGVQTTMSLANAVRQITAGSNEGSPKWLTIARNQDVLNYGAQQASVNNPDLFNNDCSVMPVIAYLSDHRAETLDRVAEVAARFAQGHSGKDRQFLLAAGSAGIETATNIVVRRAWVQMLLLVYAAVIVLSFITFRSWRAVVVAVVPLVITSVLCEALMVALGIGVKVATLPVIALGVGIGIDYALYLLSVQLAQQRLGVPLAAAYRSALEFTGRVVVLVGVTLAVGVATWALSPIKFQADMGILLAFMFLWNMVGAVVLIPALSRWLLPGATPAAQPTPAMAVPA
ncbi:MULTISPECIES: efflux RND transporter permease subunit [Ramlibacter]|uniref:MMPL family transporter n=1 Tax=Ramlibacter pinisoli TaxID=2682844 RepID=A0A6N8ITG7_9BURK|nr:MULTISPECIES: MMPL family transporter [Ramlibacter]MBA2965209.1 MMPL family transporter [Ramlibacter sp. CGMCC 1.13660]MVQ30174.1 MMPL family transporter [Ramlibacter pinisoli]